MDRNEYKIKIDQMKSLLEEGDVETAEEVADALNWRREKRVSTLLQIAEVYEKAGRYEESKNVYIEAYNRSPVGGKILYRLVMVSIKAGDIDDAETFYQEFLEIAPTDSYRFIIKYQILKAKGASVSELISVLEEFKENDVSDRWFLELAMLYHKAGFRGKCVELCDEIILWFGDGKYVEKALELKMIYHPLTQEQERKYRKIRQSGKKVIEVFPEEELRSGEILTEKKLIPEVTTAPEAFNTVNLQKELQENMKMIMEATEKQEVSSHIEKIKELASTIPYLNIPEELDAPDEEKYGHIETEEEIDTSLKIDFQELLAEESGGQMSMQFDNQPPFERQITGQMSIEDILAEWEKTKQAAQKSLEIAEQKKLESAKAKALHEAEGIMERINDVIPQLNAGKDPREIFEEEYDKKIAKLEEDGIDAELVEEETKLEEEIIPEVGVQEEEELIPEEETYEGETQEEELSSEEEEASEEEDIDNSEDDSEEVEFKDQVPGIKTEPYNPKDLSKTIKVDMEDSIEPGENKNEKLAYLSDEQRSLFTYFVEVEGMEKQICQVLSAVLDARQTEGEHCHILVEGGRGSGKTSLVLDLIKAIRLANPLDGQKIGKISAEALNKQSVLDVVNKVKGGYLVIEKAGAMTKETAEGLNLVIENDKSGLTIIVEDTYKGLERLKMLSLKLYQQFNEKLTIPVFTLDELVKFAKSYANEKGYDIDEMAILALYNKISMIQKVDRATYVAEVKEVVDQAIENANKTGLFSIFTKKKNEDGLIIIKEKDFDF